MDGPFIRRRLVNWCFGADLVGSFVFVLVGAGLGTAGRERGKCPGLRVERCRWLRILRLPSFCVSFPRLGGKSCRDANILVEKCFSLSLSPCEPDR